MKLKLPRLVPVFESRDSIRKGERGLQKHVRGRKSLMSPRVMSSGKDPPVFSNRDLRKVPSSSVKLASAYASEKHRYRD